MLFETFARELEGLALEQEIDGFLQQRGQLLGPAGLHEDASNGLQSLLEVSELHLGIGCYILGLERDMQMLHHKRDILPRVQSLITKAGHVEV